MLDVIFTSDYHVKYLAAADDTLAKLLAIAGKPTDRIPRQHITPYALSLVPIAMHAGLISSDFSGSDVRAAKEVSQFLFGPKGAEYTHRLLALSRDPSLAPVAIAIAKHWDTNLNPRLWDAFQLAMRKGKDALNELIDVDGRVAWDELWPHLSRTVMHTVENTPDHHLFVSISKRNILDQMRALCEQPTCLYPANREGQEYGARYVLDTKIGEVMPVIAVAHDVSKKRGGKSRVVGRLTMFADPGRGNVYLVSTPVG